MGIWLSAGNHTVSMEYTPKGLIPGTLISAASAVLLALIAAGGHLLRRYREDLKYEQDAEAYDPYVDEDGVPEQTAPSGSEKAYSEHLETEQTEPDHPDERE